MKRLTVSLRLIIGLALAINCATAQELRSTEIIKQARQATPDIDAGKNVYGEQCANCHGSSGFGNANEVIPALAGQLPVYVIKQLVDLAEGERESADMHKIVARKSLGTPQTLSDVAGYLGSLDPNPQPETGDGTRLDLGKRYYRGLCADCHGPQGGGNEPHATPALRRQHYSYLLTQMRQISSGHRYAVNPEIVDMLQQLSLEKLMSIADYASRLPLVDDAVVRSEPAK
jgi:cytochrome c553